MKKICFIEMMGEIGSYDASVYDHFENKDNEGQWFINRFKHIVGINITSCNVCLDEDLPGPEELDALVLAGTTILYTTILNGRKKCEIGCLK